MNYNDLPWRVGTKVRRTIYAVLPQTDADAHQLLGLMDTPELALEAVTAHNNSLEKLAQRNSGFTSYSYAEKEQLIFDLEATLKKWHVKPHLEESILLATNGGVRSERVYSIIGISADVLGPQADIPRVIAHAVDLIRKN